MSFLLGWQVSFLSFIQIYIVDPPEGTSPMIKWWRDIYRYAKYSSGRVNQLWVFYLQGDDPDEPNVLLWCLYVCVYRTEEVVPCLDRQAVFRFLIAIAPCVDHVCGDYGFCREYFSGVLHFSACACTASKNRHTDVFVAACCLRHGMLTSGKSTICFGVSFPPPFSQWLPCRGNCDKRPPVNIGSWWNYTDIKLTVLYGPSYLYIQV